MKDENTSSQCRPYTAGKTAYNIYFSEFCYIVENELKYSSTTDYLSIY